MKHTDLKRFASAILSWITDKPRSKYQAFAYAWDRGIAGLLAFSLFITNQAGILLLLLGMGAFIFFGLYLISKGR